MLSEHRTKYIYEIYSYCNRYRLLAVRTTRPEKCDILAQRYQSQPISIKFQNPANIF